MSWFFEIPRQFAYVQIPAIEGTAQIRIPQGTPNGKEN